MTAMQMPPNLPIEKAHPPKIARALGWMFNPRGVDDIKRLRQAVGGKTILITGASFGLGEATARRMAQAGATVLIVARSQEKLDLISQDLAKQGSNIFSYVTDLTDSVQVETLITALQKEHPKIDIIVNNAGKSIRRSITLSFDRFRDFERTNATNYLGPVRLLLGLLPTMQANGGGQIINISTIGTRIPPGARWAAYQASKGAFDIWMRSVALEMEPFGIKTTTLYMALIYTRMSSPTPIFRVLPGLYPEEAAHLVERAIIDKPREINPPWLRPVEITTTVMRGASDWAFRMAYRFSRDTQKAKGI